MALGFVFLCATNINKMTDSVWYKKIENKIHEQNEQLYKKDFKFYHVDTFLKLAKRIDSFSVTCATCKHLKTSIEEISENLNDYLKGDIVSRKKYERKLDEMNKHIRSIHKIYPKQFNLSLFSFIGLAVGLLAGWFIAYLVDKEYAKHGLILGFMFGIIVGRIIGKIRDNKLKKEGRVLD